MMKGKLIAIIAFILTLTGLFIFFSNTSYFNYHYTLWVWPWMLMVAIPLLVLGLAMSIISIIIYRENNEKPVLAIITLAIIVLFAISTQTVTKVVINVRGGIGLPVEIPRISPATYDNPFVVEETAGLPLDWDYERSVRMSIFNVNDYEENDVWVYMSKCLDKNGKDITSDFNFTISGLEIINPKSFGGYNAVIRLSNHTAYSDRDTVTCWINASLSNQTYSKQIQILFYSKI
jgi:hypothetical protein